MNGRINLRLIPVHCKEGGEVQFSLCVSAATRLASTSGAEAKASKRSDNLAALERLREIAVICFGTRRAKKNDRSSWKESAEEKRSVLTPSTIVVFPPVNPLGSGIFRIAESRAA